MLSETRSIDTSSRTFVDLTQDLREFATRAGRDGLAHVFVPHATAGVAIFETGSGTEEDLRDAVDRLLPRDERYRHSHGSKGHGADHVLPALIAPSISVPVVDGKLALGTWQSVVLVDTNVDNPQRTVRLSFLAG
jgi:secondary thiamine-phosphate synthase enzyme